MKEGIAKLRAWNNSKKVTFLAYIELQENGYYFGYVTNSKDQITFQSKNPAKLMEEFKLSVEEYFESELDEVYYESLQWI